MPKVSVVIPSYNHEKYVGEAIQSVLNQTYQDFEIIITDDASTDNTVNEIKKFKDPRIKLLQFEKNQGGSVAANNCIEHATGEYIAMLSSDDVFLPNKLEKQVKFLDENKNIGAVFGYAQIIDEEGNDFTDKTHFYYSIFKQPNRTRFEWLNHFFYKWNCLCHPSMLIRKECYKETGLYDPRYAQLPDFDMWIKLCMKYEIHIIPENLIKFRIRKNEANMSGLRPETKIRGSIEFREILKNYLNIKTVKDLNEIFPDSFSDIDKNDTDLIPFCISMLALKTTNKLQFEYQYFAINNLFALLNDSKLTKKIQKTFNFTYSDFIRTTGKDDYATNLGKITEDRETYAKSLDKAIKEKDEYLKTLEKSIKEKDEYITNIENRSKESVAYSKDLEKSVKDKEKYITDLDKAIKEKDEYLKTLEKSIKEKDEYIADLDKTAKKSSKYAKDLEKNIEEKEKYIIDLNKAVKESETYAKSLDKAIKEKDEYLKTLEKSIKEKDNYILSVKKDLESTEKELKETAKNLEERKAYIDNLWKNRIKKRLKIKYYK